MERKHEIVKNIDEILPAASNCPITAQIPAENGNSNLIKLNNPFSFFILIAPSKSNE